MVQPLPPVVSAIRPESVMARQGARATNASKSPEFREFLRALEEPLTEPPSSDPAGCSEPAPSARAGREITVEDDPYRALAPAEQSSWGRVNPDPAEWLATIASTGGTADPRAAQTTTSSHAPELSQLVEGWVRRVALGGDQRRAVARLDIG